MLKSMTAYGRAHKTTELGHFSVEVSSVNRKHLEVSLSLPKELMRFEPELRKLVASKAVRGQVSVKISATFNEKSPLSVTPNLALAKQIKSCWETLAKELGIPAEKGFELQMLAQVPEVLLYHEEWQEEEGYRQVLVEVVEAALKDFVRMKLGEGALLQEEIRGRLQRLEALALQVAAKSGGATEKYRQKLMDRLHEVLVNPAFHNEERILREVALYAEKIDIAEEISRLQSHLTQCQEMVCQEQTAAGKTLEFLLQELNREANTIGSKSSELEISRLVIEIKGEIEKIREQIQNIE
jgi:uncharacterized protein (TIGR00255 family)